MRVLFAIWDGAGNLPPTLALISALAARGHEVLVLAHDSQEVEITRVGGMFHSYATAPQFDQSMPHAAFDFLAWLTAFNDIAARDFMKLSLQLDPDIIVIDSMMSPTLAMGWSTGKKLVALVHQAYSAMAPWSEMIAAADLSLCFSYEAFDKGTKFPRKMHFVGPLRPPAIGQPFTRKFPDRPLVVASLSTGHQGPFQLGLLQRLCDALSSLPIEGLVTTGRGIGPEEVTAAPNVTSARNVDHTQVLPAASLFVTHCGHGSIMAALQAGVPMLCLPPLADQPHNATLVQRLELGEVLDVMSPAPIIAAAVERLLADKKLCKTAKKFAKRKTFPPRPDQAVKLIEKLAR